jgi:hypothetical protein
MRRALVLAGVIVVGLLAMVPTVAAAAPVRSAGVEVERELVIGLPAEGGFSAAVSVTDNDGDVKATLIVGKAHQVAYYSAPAKVTAKRVTARFGTLGALDFRFGPKGRESGRCLGAYGYEEAEFEGTFAFTGENEYVHIEADHAEGTVQAEPPPKGCASPRRARRAVPYRPTYSDEGATLEATAGSRDRGRARELSVYDAGSRAHGRRRGAIFGDLWEEREGMIVSRGAQIVLRPAFFRWNLDTGTATLRPPAPFTGSATFTRHGTNGHGTWTGSLSMPVLGGEPVELAGSDFRAYIHKGVPQDE